MHTLIVGNNTMDRSGFLARLLTESKNSLPIYGFCTTMETPDATGAAPIYIHSIAGKRWCGSENLVGYCKNQKTIAFLDVFERYAHLLEDAPADGIILMDELGPMESRATRFCAAVSRNLDGSAPVLASVRDKDTPFLQAVRAHPNARCFMMETGENGALFEEALIFFKAQLNAFQKMNERGI